MTSFAQQHQLWDDQQQEAAKSLKHQWRADGIEFVRFVFPDQHSQLRGKTLVLEAALQVLDNGINMTSTLLAKDTSHKTVFPVFSRGGGFDFPGMQGAQDFVMLPDPNTAKVLPWARNTAWVLCDPYQANGNAIPITTRPLLKKAIAQLERQGLSLKTGLEVEFHVFRRLDEPLNLEDSGQPGRAPKLGLISQGYQYLTEQRYDIVAPLMERLHDTLIGLDLPLRSLEIEYGPSQLELTFGPCDALTSADQMVLLRSAIKQTCQREGLLATFMCRPRIPNAMSSGWHLHQSLVDTQTQQNVMIPNTDTTPLSPIGMQFMAGLLHYARDCTLLTTPTINGYRRYRALSLAPDRAAWAHDNRGAMLRVLGGVGRADTRIENRVGEPAANPYLYIASQIFSGQAGINQQLEPGLSADEPYQSSAPALPKSLPEAISALDQSALLRTAFGDTFVDYYCFIKEAEHDRFQQEVTTWEEREYLDLF